MPTDNAVIIGTFDQVALSYFATLSGAGPAELFQSPKVYFTAPQEQLTTESLAFGFEDASPEVLVTYAGHQYLYNPSTGITEFNVFVQPLVPRVQTLGEFSAGTYQPGYTPYFSWLHDPMRSSRVRSFCNSLGQSLFADRSPLRLTLQAVPSTHVLARTFNASTLDAKLPRI